MKNIFLGNQAIVRGALEAGVQFVSTYPGTPASGIGNAFSKIADKHKIYFEYSVNEKVALEAGAGAAFSGLRSLVAMKNFGLNVAADFLMPLMYTGIKGALVLVAADDVGCSSSAQSEQNSRGYSIMAHIPTLEPADPQECKDFTKLAFKISEKYRIPVMVRTTTRVALQGAPVNLGKLVRSVGKGRFVKNTKQFVTMPPRVLQMKQELLDKVKKIRKEIAEKSKINLYEIPNTKYQIRNTGIITSVVSYLYAIEALQELKLNLPVLKLGFFYPLAEEKIKSFIKNKKKVLVIEELEPYLEKEIKILAQDINPRLKVHGKDYLPVVGELRPEYVMQSIAKLLKIKYQIQNTRYKIQKHSPQLCPGCPYWLVFQAVKNAVNTKQVIFGGEIGCYMMAGQEPHNIQDYLYCMGSSVGVAHGISKSTGQKLISFVGDSSFFHAGIPALLNAVVNKSNILIIILDNSTTAMTGHQPHPGTRGIKIENIVRACGVKNLKIINPKNIKILENIIKDFINKKEVSVIIARQACVKFLKSKQRTRQKPCPSEKSISL